MINPRDFQSQEQAAPQEQAEIQADPFTNAGTLALPGNPTSEAYQIGNENNARQGIGSLAGLPTDFNMGAMSDGEGLMRDAMSGVYPNPITPFPHVAPGYALSQNDAMEGITYPVVPVTMAGADMYFTGIGTGVQNFHEANAQPEIAPDPSLPPMTTTE